MPRRSTQKWVTKMVQELGPSRKRKQILGIGTTYDPRKAIGEVCLLLFSLVGTPWRALLAMITVAFGVLRVRDWQIHPAKATAAEAATDGLAMGACMLLSQIYFHVQSPSFAATNFTEVRHGVGLSMVAITTWRLIFHLATSKNDAQAEPEYRVFSAAVRVIALIWTAVQFTIATSLQAVPDAGHARDLLLGYTTMGSLIVLYRLRKKSGGSFFWDVPREKPLSSDPVVE